MAKKRMVVNIDEETYRLLVQAKKFFDSEGYNTEEMVGAAIKMAVPFFMLAGSIHYQIKEYSEME